MFSGSNGFAFPGSSTSQLRFMQIKFHASKFTCIATKYASTSIRLSSEAHGFRKWQPVLAVYQAFGLETVMQITQMSGLLFQRQPQSFDIGPVIVRVSDNSSYFDFGEDRIPNSTPAHSGSTANYYKYRILINIHVAPQYTPMGPPKYFRPDAQRWEHSSMQHHNC